MSGKFIVLMAWMSLVGCANGPFSAARDLDSGEKQPGTVISCSGYKAWSDCVKKATKTCLDGYVVLEKEEILVAQERTLRIICK